MLSGRVVAEELRPSPRVSGARVRGYAVLPASREGRPEFIIHVPENWVGGPVCLRVLSADALYEAAVEFNVDAARAGERVVVQYESEFFGDFWSARAGTLDGDALAALANDQGCAVAGQDAGTSFPVTGETGQAQFPSLLLNSFGAEGGFVQIGDSADSTPCAPITAPVRTGYDMRCEIRAADHVSGPLRVTVWPMKGGEIGLPIEVTVWPVP